MAVKKELTIVIMPDGSLELETKGFKGADCNEEVKPIIKGLGEIKKQTKTNEFYEAQQKVKTKTTAKTK